MQKLVSVWRQRGFFRIDFDNICAARTCEMRQLRRGINQRRSADRDKHGTRCGRGMCAFERGHGQTLSKPNHARTLHAAARAVRQALTPIFDFPVFPTFEATAHENVAVQFNGINTTGLLMIAIDTLGEENELSDEAAQLRERVMAGVGLMAAHPLATMIIPLPHQLRIAREGLGRGQFFRAIRAPQSARAAKRGQSAFGGNTRAGEHRDLSSAVQLRKQAGRDVSRL